MLIKPLLCLLINREVIEDYTYQDLTRQQAIQDKAGVRDSSYTVLVLLVVVEKVVLAAEAANQGQHQVKIQDYKHSDDCKDFQQAQAAAANRSSCTDKGLGTISNYN